MEEQLRNGLLSLTVQTYEIGYLLLEPDLTISDGNLYVERWLGGSYREFMGRSVTEAIPELIGSEETLGRMRVGEEAFHLEAIFRPWLGELDSYFDIRVIRLRDEGNFLLTTSDVTRQAHQEFLLQQQRNEVKLLSARLTHANERLSYIINRLVPESVAKLMMANRHMPEPGGEMQREATILFADMRDFTVFAEVYQPADTLEFLNTYLSIVAEAILRHQGSLVQLVGDMIMGVFNIPEEQADHPLRAVRAALDIQQSLQAFNRTADSRFPSVSFGVGISTGPVIAGYLGMQQRFRYAVVGDATNVAFHLSSLAAPGRILLSEKTAMTVAGHIQVIEKGDFQLKRRRRLVKVYELSALRSDLLAEPDAQPAG
jgi:adenylate cyclase